MFHRPPHESPAATPLHSSEQREREAAWKEIEFLALRTHDIHHPAPETTKEEIFTALSEATACVEDVSQGNLSFFHFRDLTDSDRRLLLRVKNLLKRPDIVHRLLRLIESTSVSPTSFTHTLAQKYPNLSHRAVEAHEADAFVARLTETFQTIKKPRILSLSDSHATTGAVLEAAYHTLGYTPCRTAVLSFDHHTDTYALPQADLLKKANVMRWLLEKDYVGAVGVIGSEPVTGSDTSIIVPGARFISSENLHTSEGTFNQEKFIERIRSLFHSWREQGIEDVYCSIDLDGLRVDELGYTATDYAQDRLLSNGIRRLGVFREASNLNRGNIEGRQQFLRKTLSLVIGGLTPYVGIPARCISHAIQLLQEGPDPFHIGIRTNTGQVLVGDVVEFSGPDNRQHTSRITQALLNTLVQAAQYTPPPANGAERGR